LNVDPTEFDLPIFRQPECFFSSRKVKSEGVNKRYHILKYFFLSLQEKNGTLISWVRLIPATISLNNRAKTKVP
jgi:hypothetical protein